MYAACYADPLTYVMLDFPWQTEPSIQMVKLPEPWRSRYQIEFGPDQWTCEFLEELGKEIAARGFDGATAVAPIRFATVSGHGVGKSVSAGFLSNFIMRTRPFSRGTVTANSDPQLRTKTWAEIGKWNRLSLSSHWFDFNSSRGNMSFRHKDDPQNWFCTGQTSREENSESFAGQHAANSTSWYLFDEACHDDQTDVMTLAGWKRFKDVTADDQLLTPAGWQNPTALHISRRTGTMKVIQKRGLSMRITPNHDLWLRNPKTGALRKKAADRVSLCGEIAPRTVDWSAGEYPVSDDQLRLDGWYYSEGHLMKNNYVPKENSGRSNLGRKWHGFGITNKDSRGIPELLTRMGLNWQEATTASTRQWLVFEPALGDRYAEQGKNCLVKGLPAWMFSLSQRQMRVFLDVYAEGDGYVKVNKRVLYTSSPRMADDLHALACLAGFNSSLTRRAIQGKRTWIKDHWATSSCDGYVVTLSETEAGVKISRSCMTDVEYDGMVYCATVPAGLLFTRHNGTVVWSGNSGIPDKIFDVRLGGLTDGEPMIFDFGNPTRNSGAFYEECEGKLKHTFIVRNIDSRSVQISNKAYLQSILDDYGDDSDTARIRVKGQFPLRGSSQFIGTAEVDFAMLRPLVQHPNAQPLVIGVDCAREGNDDAVIFPRIGLDARSWGAEVYRGLDNIALAEKVIAMVARFKALGVECKMIFVDLGNTGSGVLDYLTRMGYPAVGVHFGGSATNPVQYFNKAAEMWGRLRDDLGKGLCLPMRDAGSYGKVNADSFSEKLRTELTNREYGHTDKDQIRLERKRDMKKRLGASPDRADALVLTYATPIAMPLPQPLLTLQNSTGGRNVNHDYDPMNTENW